MVISGYAFVTGAFGTSDCSMRAAADSCPHPGLVELPNIVDATPPQAWPAATGFCNVWGSRTSKWPSSAITTAARCKAG